MRPRAFLRIRYSEHVDASPLQGRVAARVPRPTTTTTTITTHPYSSSSSSLTAPHHDLRTFLAHAHRTGLSRDTTTFKGTRYEYVTQRHLSAHYGFTDLHRVGGRGDAGIDLLGSWTLPALPVPVRVIVQCKRFTSSKTTAGGPALVRELEGAFRGAPSAWRRSLLSGQQATLGVLVCTRLATKGVREAMGRSNRPLAWIRLEEEEHDENEDEDEDENEDEGYDRDGNENKVLALPKARVSQILYNAAAVSNCGLEGLSVGLKYGETGERNEVQLLWQGNPIDFTPPRA